jgi:hypothetical protein
MEKKEFKLELPKNITVAIGRQDIEMRPYISITEYGALISSYVDAYFNSAVRDVPMDKYNVIGAEHALILALVDILTSIEIKEGTPFEILYYDTNIWYEIESNISNYSDFRSCLDRIVANIKEQIEQEKSIGTTIDSLGKKIEVLLTKVSQSIENFKPEDLEKLKAAGNELIKNLNEAPVAKQVIDDSERGSK